MHRNETTATTLLSRLGIRPVINACGIYTDLGGSRMSPAVWAAATALNDEFVSMVELLDKTGEHIARLLNVPAARITPGAAAAIALGTAAVMSGRSGKNSEQLPNTKGMKSDVLIQTAHRYKYDRQIRLTGARLLEVGNAQGATPDDLEMAITDETAMILHPAHLDGASGALTLDEVSVIARRRQVPVFVDAAYMNYPTAVMGSYLARGANLVSISAKYFGGPNAGGFLLGDTDLIGSVSNVHFTRYESGDYLKFGRTLKMDRQTVIAVVVALEEWLETDHDARLASYKKLAKMLHDALAGLPGLSPQQFCFTMDERYTPEPINSVLLRIDKAGSGIGAVELAAALAAENPSILANLEVDAIGFCLDSIREDEVVYLGERIRSIIKGSSSAL